MCLAFSLGPCIRLLPSSSIPSLCVSLVVFKRKGIRRKSMRNIIENWEWESPKPTIDSGINLPQKRTFKFPINVNYTFIVTDS